MPCFSLNQSLNPSPLGQNTPHHLSALPKSVVPGHAHGLSSKIYTRARALDPTPYNKWIFACLHLLCGPLPGLYHCQSLALSSNGVSQRRVKGWDASSAGNHTVEGLHTCSGNRLRKGFICPLGGHVGPTCTWGGRAPEHRLTLHCHCTLASMREGLT